MENLNWHNTNYANLCSKQPNMLTLLLATITGDKQPLI